MGVYLQKGSKNYWISIYRDGKRHFVPSGTPDREKAEALENQLKLAMKGNLARERLIQSIDTLMGWDVVKGVGIEQVWPLYLKSNPNVSAHTLGIRENLCKDLVRWLKDSFPTITELKDITPQHAQAFMDHLVDLRGGVGKTKNTRAGHMRTVFKTIIVRANLKSNPFDFVLKEDESDSLSGRPFSKSEQDKIFKRCQVVGHDWETACQVARYSGMRLKDIALLKWDRVEQGAIDITPEKTKKHNIRVRIPIHPTVQQSLNALPKAGPYVFPVLAKRYQVENPDSGFMPEVIHPLKLKSGGSKISFHCWRHTFATAMSKAKVDKEIRMKLGGWKNESTADIYNHFEDFEKLQQAIEALD